MLKSSFTNAFKILMFKLTKTLQKENLNNYVVVGKLINKEQR